MLRDRATKTEQGLRSACASVEVAGVAAAGEAAGPAAAIPPSGNTGGKLTVGLRVGLDGLGCTVPDDRRSRVKMVVSRFLGQGQDGEKGLHWYDHTHWWESGAVLAWSDERPECWLSINGDSAAVLGLERLWELIQELESFGAKGTRLDPFADDESRQVLVMDQIHGAASAGDVLGFKRYEPRRPRKLRTGELEGDTAYFGRRGSDGGGKYVRFYDKRLESGGRVQANRFEVEFSGQRAAVLFECLASASSLEKFHRMLGRALGGAIDFRERAGHVHVDRMKRLEWWEKVIDVLGRAEMAVQTVVPPLQKTLEYFRDNWTRTLAKACLILEELGYDGLAIVQDLIRRKFREAGAWRPGARDLGLDVERLLGIKSLSEFGGVS